MSQTEFFIFIVAAYGITILIGRRLNADSKATMFLGFMMVLGWPITFATILGVYHYSLYGH
jgi:surface polysaccharide O-acyltransferase-like enzyme